MTDTQLDPDRDVFEDATPSSGARPEDGWITLPSCDLLTVERADEFLRWRPAKIVAIIGERKGGKTTLVVELYERFLRGVFAEQQFRYSQTLFGFEKRSYPSRADSGGTVPETDRTSRQDGLLFFHLGLTSQRDGVRRDLLLTERAGEVYRDVRDRPSDGEELVELKRASIIAFILDGERVSDGRTRAEAFASVRNTLRAFVDSRRIESRAEIQLITTKCDLVEANANLEASAALTDFEEQFKKRWKDQFASVACWRTAARDPTGKLPPAWGLEQLLSSWIEPSERAFSETRLQIPPLEDEFDRLLLRTGNIG